MVLPAEAQRPQQTTEAARPETAAGVLEVQPEAPPKALPKALPLPEALPEALPEELPEGLAEGLPEGLLEGLPNAKADGKLDGLPEARPRAVEETSKVIVPEVQTPTRTQPKALSIEVIRMSDALPQARTGPVVPGRGPVLCGEHLKPHSKSCNQNALVAI